MSPYIEIHHNGQWHRAAKLHVLGEDRIRVDYDTGYLFSHESQPISLGLPLNMDPYAGAADDLQGLAPPDPTPAFLFDLVPQGRGREFLLGLLGMRSDATQIVPLIMNGAFNPIGRLRVTTAMDFYRAQVEKDSTRDYLDGFTLKDIATKSEDFLDHLSVHAMLAAGTTGVQGVAPKFLLNQDAQGRWFADMALPDEAVESHWLVKRPRGRNPEDRTVLRNEAAYLRVAERMGLRTHGKPALHGDMLFVQRFDRIVEASGVVRLHQESLASIAGLKGFAVPTDHNALIKALRVHATDPTGETVEYILRDAMNQALRNTDNHARNTAMQILPDGTCQLTPVFDFCPMFMDPEGISRAVHWRDMAGKRIETLTEAVEQLVVADDEKTTIAQRLKAFGNDLEKLPAICRDEGVEPEVLEQCQGAIKRVARELQAIPVKPSRAPRKRVATTQKPRAKGH